MKKKVTLTDTDRAILESYKTVLEGLEHYLGNSYEFVLHSLEDPDRSVIKIINGYHTGRSVGAPITNLALEMMEAIENSADQEDYISYFSTNQSGEPLKSTTIAIRGTGGEIIGLICINFYMSTPYIDILKSMGFNMHLQLKPEYFMDHPEINIPQAVVQAKQAVELNANIPSSQRNKAIISELNEQGLFRVKNSVEMVSKELGLSANTVYLHLRSLKKE